MTAAWSYITTDLRTREVLTWDLPLTGVGFNSPLSDVGEFSAQIDSDQARLPQDLRNFTMPARTALWAVLGTELMWGGIIWGRRPNKSGVWQIDGKEFASYFDQRRIRSHFDPVLRDQLDLVRLLIQDCQSKPGGNINLQLPPQAVSGHNVTYGYDPWDRKNLLEEITQIASDARGFDWGQEVFWDSDNIPSARFMYYFPKRGLLPTETTLRFTDENTDDWDWSEDGVSQANMRYGVGNGDGAAQLEVVVSAPEVLDAGYPLLEAENDYSLLGDRTQIEGLVRAQLAIYKWPVQTGTLTVQLDADPVYGSYRPGDWAEMDLTGDNFPWDDVIQKGHLQGAMRISNVAVNPDNGTATVTVGAL